MIAKQISVEIEEFTNIDRNAMIKQKTVDLFSLIDTNDMSEGERGMSYGYDAMWDMYQSMSILLPMNNSA